MKGTIILASIIVGLSIFVSRDIYEFHYVGEEHFNNEAASYVLNKKTGHLTRYSSDYIKRGNGSVGRSVTIIDMNDGSRNYRPISY